MPVLIAVINDWKKKYLNLIDQVTILLLLLLIDFYLSFQSKNLRFNLYIGSWELYI